MIVLLGANQAMSSPAMVAAAFLGSLITIGFVLLIARRISSMAMLIVAGVMVGYICSAGTNFLIAFADDQSIVNLHNWSLGSFSGSSWDDIAVIAVVVITVSACVFAISKPLSAFQLGEAYAKSVGVNVARFRVVLVLLASILSACVTAFAGPVSFVGIAVPHLVKSALKSSKPIRVIPACFLGRHLLRGLRFDRAHAVLSRRAFHQRRHRHLRRAGGYRAHVEETGEVDGNSCRGPKRSEGTFHAWPVLSSHESARRHFRLVRNCARNASFERSRTSKPRSKRRLMERRFSA